MNRNSQRQLNSMVVKHQTVINQLQTKLANGGGGAGTVGPQGPAGPTGPQGSTGTTGSQGIQGIQGVQGNAGSNGTNGTNGQGVPTAGTASQALTKIDTTNFNTQWTTIDKTFVGLGNCDNTSDVNKPVSSATTTALNLKANLSSPSLVTPNIGVATGTSLAVSGLITSSGTAGIGYATGAGGTVSQATSKSTGVALSKPCGTITMNAAALAAATIVTFTVTNTTVAATDVIYAQHDTVGTIGGYTITPNTPASGSFKISVRNNTAGSLSEAIVIRFVVIKAVIA